MGETINEIERGLAAERVDLRRNLGELEIKARQLTDWRHYYRNHPAQLIGAALASGVVLGVIAGGRSSAHRDHFPEAPFPGEPSEPLEPRPRSRAMRRLENDWRHISDALMGVASAKLMEFVGNLVPGFHDQLRRDPPDATSSSSF